MSETGVRGRQLLPFNRSKKFFVKLFPKKFERTKFAEPKQPNFQKTQRATTGRPFADISYQQSCRLSADQPFFIKRLPKNFFERIERQGLRPRTPVSLCRATKGFAFGIHQLFEKSWAKTFGFVALFTDNCLLCGSTILFYR